MFQSINITRVKTLMDGIIIGLIRSTWHFSERKFTRFKI